MNWDFMELNNIDNDKEWLQVNLRDMMSVEVAGLIRVHDSMTWSPKSGKTSPS